GFTFVIIPIEYGVKIPPVGFALLPFNFAIVAAVATQVRLADFSVVLTRFLAYAVSLLVVIALCLLFVAGVTLLFPGFMNQIQMFATVLLAVITGTVLAATIPRFLPVVERVVQERFLGHRLAYQEAMAGLVKELARPATLDQMLETVATGVYSHMQVRRVLIFLLDLIGNDYRLRAQAGPNPKPAADGLSLPASSAVVRWLTEKKDALVRDEVMRAAPPSLWQQLAGEFDRFGVSLFVPMVLDDRVVGVIAIGEKLSRDMFYISDLRVLTALATELALATRYRLLEEQAIRDNRLIELGTIAAGIAHEIRNSLASVRTLAQMLPGKSTDPELCELGKRAISDVDRINRVIQNILSFARPGTVNIANHRAAELVDEALMLVQSRLKSKQIRASKKVHDSLVLRVDKPQIVQVLVNILNNAIDAVPLEGEIRIATGEHRLEPAKGQPPRRYGVIEISDNGPGVPAEIRHRIFDLFFTTKKNGTGLGLAISQKIVRDHNGLITVSSLEGQGATFQVHLPAA
ncbi:MAG: ATP-binding protein, partial [Verrucomicrobiae bacterium]|nr:ATP-binding protein [Verrucomicrobiae bacterium]